MLSQSIKLETALSKRSKTKCLQSGAKDSHSDQIAKWKESSQIAAERLANCEEISAKISQNINLSKHQKIWMEQQEKLENRRHYFQSILDHKYPVDLNTIKFFQVNLEGAINLRDSALEMMTLQCSSSHRPAVLSSIRNLKKKCQYLLQADQEDIQELECQMSSLTDKFADLLHFDVYVEFKDDIVQFSSLKYKFLDLQRQHIHDCEVLHNWFTDHHTTLIQEYESMQKTPFGGLNKQTYSIAIKLKDEYSNVHKERLTLLSEAIKRQTKLSKADILKFLDWSAKNTAYQSKKESIKLNFNQRMEAFIQSTIKGLLEEESMMAKQAEVDEDKSLRNERTKLLHTSLEHWRSQKMENMKQENEKAAMELNMSLKNEAERQKRDEERRSKDAAKLEKYHEKQQLDKFMQIQLEKQLEQNSKLKLKLEAKYNCDRVHFRANELKRKENEQLERMRKVQAEKVDLERRLETLRLSVAVEANRFLILLTDSDWNRTSGQTFASKQYKESIVKSHRVIF